MLARWLLLTPALLTPALLPVGCLDDLQEPLSCPPEAQVPAGDCSEIRPPLTGCFPPQEHACLSGPRTSCACDESECPAPDAACFPNGNCPSDVVSIAGPSVQCGRVLEEDVGDLGLIPPAFVCTCGCTCCLSVCDGKGPTFGAALLGDGQQGVDDFIVPLIRIDRQVPDAGRLGVYIRIRGLTATTLQIFRGDPDGVGDELEYLRGALVPSSPGEGFVEHVLYDELLDEDANTTPLEWSKREERPSLLALLPPTNTPGHTLFEVDCVIPFWTE